MALSDIPGQAGDGLCVTRRPRRSHGRRGKSWRGRIRDLVAPRRHLVRGMASHSGSRLDRVCIGAIGERCGRSCAVACGERPSSSSCANVLALLIALTLTSVSLDQSNRYLAVAASVSPQGDTTARVEVTGKRQSGRLSEQFNAINRRTDRSYARLEKRITENAARAGQPAQSQFLAQIRTLRTPIERRYGFPARCSNSTSGSSIKSRLEVASSSIRSGSVSSH